jgi:hypothetical protein
VQGVEVSAPTLDALSAAWPGLVWTALDAERANGTTKGGAIVVGRDFVEVYVQGIPGPAKSHDGTIEGVQRAVRASLGEVDAAIALLDPARAVAAAVLNKRAHDLANEVQGLRSIVDEAIDIFEHDGGSVHWLEDARRARRPRT